jgi:AhpD family alkylhydroperoxidase
VRLAYVVSRRRFGRVLTPLKALYARKPGLIGLAAWAERIEQRHLRLEPGLKTLIKALVASRNGCAFCSDLAAAKALQLRIGAERFAQLTAYRDSAHFSTAEKAALAYVDEYLHHRTVSDDCFRELAAHFDETKIVEITWLSAIEQY